jgi:hypothetical protein
MSFISVRGRGGGYVMEKVIEVKQMLKMGIFFFQT